jgi:catechol 2,3-dioxygenase-like lactoylglutathione lyase family enzyme
METSVRYFVDETASAIDFYRLLGFEVVMNPAPGFAMLRRGSLRLLLSTPTGGGGAGRPDAQGRSPRPGGWNRFQLEVADLGAEVARLRGLGVGFRSDVVEGTGGRQIVAEDPSGNPVELFEPSVG